MNKQTAEKTDKQPKKKKKRKIKRIEKVTWDKNFDVKKQKF